MKILAVRSVPLSKEVRAAWNAHLVSFIRRDRKNDKLKKIAETRYDALLNLGNTNYDFSALSIPVWNTAESVRAVSRPTALRNTLGEGGFLPPRDFSGPHWHKRGGFGGQGTIYHSKALGECVVPGGDIQKHVKGREYRVITVGDAVVQASQKHKIVRSKDDWEFSWEWIGVEGIRKGGFIPLVKEAVRAVPNYSQTVFGWDIIHNGKRPWIIECNTSPGVNEATAGRIVRAIEEFHNE